MTSDADPPAALVEDADVDVPELIEPDVQPVSDEPALASVAIPPAPELRDGSWLLSFVIVSEAP